MRILGIDPGLRQTGFGVIDVDGPRLLYVASGTIVVPHNLSLSTAEDHTRPYSRSSRTNPAIRGGNGKGFSKRQSDLDLAFGPGAGSGLVRLGGQRFGGTRVHCLADQEIGCRHGPRRKDASSTHGAAAALFERIASSGLSRCLGLRHLPCSCGSDGKFTIE